MNLGKVFLILILLFSHQFVFSGNDQMRLNKEEIIKIQELLTLSSEKAGVKGISIEDYKQDNLGNIILILKHGKQKESVTFSRSEIKSILFNRTQESTIKKIKALFGDLDTEWDGPGIKK